MNDKNWQHQLPISPEKLFLSGLFVFVCVFLFVFCLLLLLFSRISVPHYNNYIVIITEGKSFLFKFFFVCLYAV